MRPASHRSGAGTTAVVLVPGWLGTARFWEPIRARLESEHTVVTYDPRGFGESEELGGDGSSWTLDSAVADLRSIIDDLAPLRVVAIGSSSGGQTAIALGAAPPGNLAGIISIGGAPRWTEAAGFPFGLPPQAAAALLTQLSSDFVGVAAAVVPSAYFGGASDQATHKAIEIVMSHVRSTLRPETALEILRKTWESDIRHLLPAVSTPTLLIHGDLDTLAGPDVGRYLASRMMSARVVVIPGSAHFPFMTHPAAVHSAATDFISSLP